METVENKYNHRRHIKLYIKSENRKKKISKKKHP